MLLKLTFPVYCAISAIDSTLGSSFASGFPLSVFLSPIQSIRTRMLRWAIDPVIDLRLSVPYPRAGVHPDFYILQGTHPTTRNRIAGHIDLVRSDMNLSCQSQHRPQRANRSELSLLRANPVSGIVRQWYHGFIHCTFLWASSDLTRDKAC